MIDMMEKDTIKLNVVEIDQSVTNLEEELLPKVVYIFLRILNYFLNGWTSGSKEQLLKSGDCFPGQEADN